MSLSVSLYRKYHVSFDSGNTLEETEDCVFDANITHNLGKMAREAGIYEAVWRPYRLKPEFTETDNYDEEMKFESLAVTKAKDITPLLQKGVADMVKRPEYYIQFNSDNGWGTYKDFIPWLQNYLKACIEYPESIICVSR